MDVFKAAFYQKIPQSFRFIDDRGITHLVGSYAQTVRQFAKYKHYDFQYDTLSSYKIANVQKSIQNGVYNISMQAIAYRHTMANMSFSYPVQWSKVCIMVPAEKELSRYWYVLLPFGPYIWTFIWIMVIYVAFLMRLLRHPTPRFSKNLLTSLAVIFNTSNMNLKLLNVGISLKLFYTLLFLFGFILGSYYSSYLTVYNLKPIFQPYVRTIDDLLKSKHQVLTPSLLLEEMRNNPHNNLKRIEPLIVEKLQQEVTKEIQNFSRNYAYTVTHVEWLFFEKLQRHLIQPTYKLSDICPLMSLSSFPIADRSKFAADLDLFILLTHQSGLWNFWEEQAFVAALHAKYFRIPRDSYPIDPLNLYYYRVAWIVFFVGNIMATLCNALEVFVHNRNNEMNRRWSTCRLIYTGI